MFELVKVGEKTYYLKNATNIGVYVEEGNKVWIIDSGNDKEAGKKIIKTIEENNWLVKGIINTHSNADHIGGNKIIQDRTSATVLSHGMENYFVQSPILEASFLYGGYPFKELTNKFLVAKQTNNVKELKENLPNGIEYINLKGHFFDMIGVKTSDNVYFLGDCMVSEDTINKYHVFFIYDIQEYLNTLEYLKTLKGKKYILSHCEETEDLSFLIEKNREKINEIANNIIEICKNKKMFEEILKEILDYYHLKMNINQYVLVGSTIKSYLSWLKDNNKIEIIIENNYFYWKTI